MEEVKEPEDTYEDIPDHVMSVSIWIGWDIPTR
jgi:hypothetical protein